MKRKRHNLLSSKPWPGHSSILRRRLNSIDMKAVFNLQPLRNGPAVLRGRNKFDPLGRFDRRSGQTVGQPFDNSDGVHTTVRAEQSHQYNSPVDAITACLFRVCWFWLAEDPNFGGDFLSG